jgi:catechol 2,3-dioxygenase-like lactoylglutathione lyase family enzyme
MAGGKSTARTKKASSAKAPTKSARAAKSAKPAASRARPQTARAKTTARAKPAPAKRTARAPTAKAPAAKAPARRTTAAARGSGSALDKLQQVALTATNLDASVDFYRDTLGLKFIARFDPPGLAFFGLGSGVRLLLSATASQASLYFQVDNVDAAVKELKGRGVRFLQQPQMIQRDEAGDFGKKGIEEWMAFFNDPAGNLLALVERR